MLYRNPRVVRKSPWRVTETPFPPGLWSRQPATRPGPSRIRRRPHAASRSMINSDPSRRTVVSRRLRRPMHGFAASRRPTHLVSHPSCEAMAHARPPLPRTMRRPHVHRTQWPVPLEKRAKNQLRRNTGKNVRKRAAVGPSSHECDVLVTGPSHRWDLRATPVLGRRGPAGYCAAPFPRPQDALVRSVSATRNAVAGLSRGPAPCGPSRRLAATHS